MASLRFISTFLVALSLNVALAGNTISDLSSSHNLFAMDLFKTIAPEKSQQNVVFSPASIQSCLTLAFLGAGGTTAQQLRSGLCLPDKLDREKIVQEYAGFLKKNFNSSPKGKKDAPQLRMVSRIYVNDKFELSPKFNKLAKTSFNSEAVSVKFSNSALAVKNINKWVENQTFGKIKNLLQKGDVSAATATVLVNAIYFKAVWLKKLSSAAAKKTFKMSGGKTAKVDMMFWEDTFKYAELSDLDAKAIELPYKDSDLSMLVVLPKKVDGLKALEEKLAKIDLNRISAKMYVDMVEVELPKFRIEFGIDLEQPMMKLGMTNMFTNAADFRSMLSSKTKLKISKIKHKAFIEVNEAGSEAAAVTDADLVETSIPEAEKTFIADHPFLFAIRNREAVYFLGHMVKF